MFFKSTLLAALSIQSALADRCSTKYGTTSKEDVPTSTKTHTYTLDDYVLVTVTANGTATVSQNYSVTSTSSISTSFTYTFYEASQTVTIPTSSGFTPLASASPDPEFQRKRADRRSSHPTPRHPRRAAQVSSYPTQVVCTHTVTSTSSFFIDSTTVSAATTTKYAHSGTTTSTTTVFSTSSTTVAAAEASFPAECQSDNIINSFSGEGITDLYYYGRTLISLPCVPDPTLPTDDSCRFTGAAADSPADCCVAAYQIGAAGFSAPPGKCTTFKLPAGDTWDFYNFGTSDKSDYYIGNLANVAYFGGLSD